MPGAKLDDLAVVVVQDYLAVRIHRSLLMLQLLVLPQHRHHRGEPRLVTFHCPLDERPQIRGVGQREQLVERREALARRARRRAARGTASRRGRSRAAAPAAPAQPVQVGSPIARAPHTVRLTINP